ncbi:MAG: iron-sulfur protein [Spirochaetales bacterium]|nr:iron-sulfur protein [Spirochaetales bacterium]
MSVSAVPVPAGELRAWCAEQGFPRTATVSTRHLPAILRSHPEVAALGEGTYLLAALSCFRREPEDRSTPAEPHGLIAPFARRNYYREAVLRLRPVTRRLGSAAGVAPRELRIFCNSPLPEKPLAVASGLGAYGKNALVLIPGLGSLFVIAGIFAPLELSGTEPAERGPGGGLEVGGMCGSCTACQDACPVGALSEPGQLDQARCLQAWAGTYGELPAELVDAWGFRLYGCQVCQEVCPHNRSLREQTETVLGELGPSLPLRRVLEPDPEELAGQLRRTALGMSWISKRALQRNALLAAGHRARAGFSVGGALLRLVEAHGGSGDPVLAGAAAWALKRITDGKLR